MFKKQQRGMLLSEGLVALIVTSGCITFTLQTWHKWNQENKYYEEQLVFEREQLNMLRKQLNDK